MGDFDKIPPSDGTHSTMCLKTPSSSCISSDFVGNFSFKKSVPDGGVGKGETYLSVEGGSEVKITPTEAFEHNYFGYYHGNSREGNSLSLYSKGELLKTFSGNEISKTIRAHAKLDGKN